MKKKTLGSRFRFQSIQTTMMMSFCTLILVSLAIFLLISMNYTKNSIVKNSTDYTRQLIFQVNKNIDSYIEYMENTSQMIVRSQDVQEYLFQDDPKDVKEEQRNRVINQFETVMNSRSDIRNVAVIGNNGRMLINQGNSKLNPYHTISDEEWYKNTKKLKNGEFALSISHVQNAIAGSYPWVITLSRGIYNYSTKNMEGIMFIDLNYRTINDLCKVVSLGEKGYIYLLDKDGKIIYHPQQQLLNSGLKVEEIQSVMDISGKKDSFVKKSDGDTKVYTVAGSEKTGWTVVGVSYMSELLKDRKIANFTYIITSVLLLIAGAAVAVLISRAVTKPIKVLDHSMKEVSKGNFDVKVEDETGTNEIGRLNTTFHIMIREIKRLTAQNIHDQEEKRKAEMRALQAQINPHFLYNTLDSIIWMAESGKHNREVVLMTASLAKLLRRSIGNDDELVTIEQEIEYTKTYLTIQRMRYQDKLEFNVIVDPDILNIKVVKLTLQPLVENAIYHGIKYSDHKGTIRLKGYLMGSDVMIEVADNGMGMDDQELKEIFTEHDTGEKSNGVGVYNVQNRLQLYYGSDYGLTYQSRKGAGTIVTVRIPVSKEAADDKEKE